MDKILFCLILLVLSSGCVTMAAEYPDLSNAQLTVYVTFHEEEGRRLLDLFQQKTNCQYNYLTMPAGETASRIIEEAETPRADIVLGGPADVHQLLANMGLLEKYISPVAAEIPSKYKNLEGYWTGMYVGPIAIAINEVKWKKEFASKEIKKPETFEELLNPVYKGEIIMPSPITSGTGYTFLASLIQLWGEEKALEYFQELDRNIGEYTDSGFTVAQKVAVGEYLIGINFLHDQLLMRQFGFNINSLVPVGAGWEIGCISIIKNSPHIESAKAFVDFVLSQEAGQLHTNLTERISSRNDVKMPESLGDISLSELPINWDYDFFNAATKRAFYQRLWEEKVHENYGN